LIDSLMNWVGPLFATVGALVIGGGAITTLAFALFKLLGEKWLSARFDQQLEAYKHAQQKELEELRFKINALLDRTTKLHQREFEVLPEAWARLIDAYGAAMVLASVMQQTPDLDRMSSQHLDEFLATGSLQKWEQAELRQHPKKTDYYRDRIFWRRLDETKNRSRETHIYLRKNGIFIPVDIRKKFDIVDNLIWNVILEREVDEQMKTLPRMRAKADALNRDGENLVKALEEDIQKRLWYSDLIQA
jgi:hypothetical protein